MAHGHQDYGAAAPATTIYTIQDMAELAARLGSIVTFDRRGNVMWFDDFESGLTKWYTYGSGSGKAIAISSEAAKNGSFSAKLTTGAAINNVAEITHFSPYPVISKVGFEISFVSNDNLSSLRLSHDLYDGSHEHIARLRYLPPTDKLQYEDENGVWQDLATSLVLHAQTYIFHTIKLVIDLSTQKYVRAILDGVEYDMSALSYQYVVQAATPYWMQDVYAVTRVASNQSIYVDDAIITQNEP